MANVDLMVLAGDYVKTAVISEWKVNVGDIVKKGDVILEVETNKITQGIEAPCDGVIEQIFYEEGDDVEISKVVAVVNDGSKIDSLSEAKSEAYVVKKDPVNVPVSTGRTVISPLAKKMAKEKGIDLDALSSRFSGKRIGKDDVLAFEAESVAVCSVEHEQSEGSTLQSESVTEIPVKGLRKSVATAMKNSAYNKPHVTMIMDANIDNLLRMKEYLKTKYPEKKVTITGLVALAVRSTLMECPYMNGITTEEAIMLNSAVHLGIAVDVEGGLLVPVVRNAEIKSGLELFEAVNTVATSCKEGTLPPSDYAGGTFTISNVGASGVKYFTPIINSPEIAILGVGASRKEVVVDAGEYVERTMIGLSLSFDHAAVDGAPAGKFLKALTEKIEHPFLMAL